MTTITSSSFNVTNATAQDIQSLNLALTYLQQSSTGLAILQGMIANHDTINIQHGGAIGDKYIGNGNGSAGVINWDPNGASVVFNNSQQSIGVNSAAILLIHEGAHATDPNLLTDENQKNAQYETNAEPGLFSSDYVST